MTCFYPYFIIKFMEKFNVIASSGEGEYEEKKSRFIGHVFAISSEAEAQMLIDQIKRKYWDARHNCYAYVTGENGEILRFSDDGEPGGTAGRPILDVLTGNNLRGALIVVTRYFGGTLLGTGGLVRAYTAASKECLNNATIKQMVYAKKISIRADYTAVGKLQHLFAEKEIHIEETNYTDMVEFIITVIADNVQSILDNITQLTNGKSELTVIDTGYFVV